MPTFKQLQHAVAVARAGNFREAAHTVHLSQPALTRSIQALEAELGIQLFDRAPEGVQLTHVGSMLIERAQLIVTERDELLREAELAKGLERGSFTVSCGAYPSYRLIPLAIAEMLRSRPRMRCRIINENWRQVASRVMRRESDVGIADLRALTNDPSLRMELLGSHRFVFYAGNHHPLAGRRNLSLDELFRYPYIGTRAPPAIANLLQNVPPEGGHIDAETGDFVPAVEIESPDMARRLVLECDAIAIAPVSHLVEDARAGRLQVLDFHADWMTFSYSFLFRAGRSLAPAVKLFMQTMRSLEIGQMAREAAAWQALRLDKNTEGSA